MLIALPAQVVATAESETTTAPARGEIRDLRDSLAPQIEALRKSHGIPGLSLVVVRGREVLWAEGFGHADRARRSAATPRTVYGAGSLVKPFTALAVLQLAEAGSIDIDRPLRSYLPELKIRSRFEKAAPPTVRSVLTHHSGLPTDLTKGMWTDAPFTSVAAALGEEYMAFPPNLVFSYSNVGYALLGHMVQRASGVPYAEYVQRAIFAPLGMTHTAVGLRPDLEGLLARGYRDGIEVPRLPVRDLPALGLYTTAADLGRFMSSVLAAASDRDGRVPTAAVWRQMVEPQNRHVALDLNISVGLGWFLEDGTVPGGGTVVRHGGTTLDSSGELILLPELGLGVAVLANSYGSRAVVSELAEQILARLVQAGGTAGAPAPLKATIGGKPKQGKLADIEGSYATDFGLITIGPGGRALCACLMDRMVDLIRYPDGWFGIATEAVSSLPDSMGSLGGSRFQAQQVGGRQVLVATNGEQRVVVGEKVVPEPVPPVWRDRAGDYELLNPDAGFPLTEPRLRIRDGQLCMSYRLPRLSDQTIQVPLQPVSDSEAIILGLGRTRGETVRALTVNGEERLRYSGFVWQKRRGTAD